MGISDVSGIFKTFDLAVASQAKDFSDAKVNFSIDVNSIDTNVDARDNHLKVLTFRCGSVRQNYVQQYLSKS